MEGQGKGAVVIVDGGKGIVGRETAVGGADSAEGSVDGQLAAEFQAPGKSHVGLAPVDSENQRVGTLAHPVQDVAGGDGGIDGRVHHAGGGNGRTPHGGRIRRHLHQHAVLKVVVRELVVVVGQFAIDLEEVTAIAGIEGNGVVGIGQHAPAIVEAGVGIGDGRSHILDGLTGGGVEMIAPGHGSGAIVDNKNGGRGAVANPIQDVAGGDGAFGLSFQSAHHKQTEHNSK